MSNRQPFDMSGYLERSQRGPCFVCEMLAGNPAYRHHLLYEDEQRVVFLNKYPPLYGYTLVAPKAHREQVTGDFSVDEYLHLQRVICRVAQALRQVVPTEHLYRLSLGSQQGNRHVHWHLVPLPAGVPYEEQQLEALRLSRRVLALKEEEMANLATRLPEAIRTEHTI
jgi:diadenosine tetraphosphate (Ap4A) HIT family hydrolase